jgi:amidase
MRFTLKLTLIMLGMIHTIPSHAYSPEEKTISEIHQAILKHELTCKSLVNQYIERIKLYNLSTLSGAPINALTEINPSALTQAELIDDTFARSGKLIGALHCIPVILKDNIDSYDTTTTSGSYALLGNQPAVDAALVKQLRQAGAIILGKGGMDEFAWGMYGYSSRSGRIGNVYDTNKNPGGSSGGTAAAVSANFAMIGVGTDNSGSVRIPAVFNGLTGMRPTAGLISQYGIFPMGNIDGTAGPIARTTTDLAKLLSVMAAPEHADKNGYETYLDKNGLKNKRIGIVKLAGKINPFQDINPEVMSAIDQAINLMKQHGVTFVEITLPQFNNNREYNQAGEVEDINAYLQSFAAVRKDFRDICESDRTRNFGDVKACLKYMNKNPGKSDKRYKEYIEKEMTRQHLDALLQPLSTKPSGSYDGSSIMLWQSSLSSNAGLPAIDFVIGHDKSNMPIGIDLIGLSWHEGNLIAIAYAFEQLTKLRKAPELPQGNLKFKAVSIPQMNNIFSLISKHTYDDIIRNASPKGVESEVYAPDKFRKLVDNVISNNTQRQT